jgi:Ni,Fe-hydrogenase I large subunit
MSTTITIDPVTRIEGHLAIEVMVDNVYGQQQVVDARSDGSVPFRTVWRQTRIWRLRLA